MKKITLIVILLTIISKVLGFMREVVVSFYYGMSDISDVYFISMTIPAFLFAVVGTGIMVAYIPIYSEISSKHGKNSADNFTNILMTTIVIIVSFIVIFLIIFTEKLLGLFAPGFNGDTLNLAIGFTRITIFSLYFIGLMNIIQGYLQIYNKFYLSSLIGIPFNLAIIISIIFSFIYKNPYLIPVGIVIGYLSQVLMMVPSLMKTRFTFKLQFNIFDENIRKMFIFSIPVIIGVSASELNSLVDRSLASKISIGGISAMNYAGTINTFVTGVFALTIATVFFPVFTKLFLQGDIKALKKNIVGSIELMNFLIIPCVVITICYAEDIVTLLFGRGAFDQIAIETTSSILICYAVGMIAIGNREILTRVFYSISDTRTPMVNTAISMGVSIILNFILSSFMGLKGLALSTSIAAIFSFFLMNKSLKKSLGQIDYRILFVPTIKIIISSGLMILIVNLIFSVLDDYISIKEIVFLSSLLMGIIVYILISYILGIKESKEIFSLIKKVN